MSEFTDKMTKDLDEVVLEDLNRIIEDGSDTDEPTPEQRLAKLEALLSERADYVQARLSRGIRNLMGQGQLGGLSAEDQRHGGKALALLAETLRHTASLLDNLHELATSKVHLTKDENDIARNLVDLVGACRDLESFQKIHPNRILDVVMAFHRVADLLDHSEHILEIASDLSTIDKNVSTVGVKPEDFQRLVGPNPGPNGPRPEEVAWDARLPETKEDENVGN